MASLSNINGLFDVHSTGAILFSTSHGTSGQILKSNGNAAPTWVAASTVIGGPYLPLTGGTLTGATATASGISFTVGGTLTVGGNNVVGFSGSWNGANMPGSRWNGYSVNGGEIVFQRDNPNSGQMSILVDGGYYAGENNGFYSLYSANSYNSKAGFYADTSGVLQFNASSTFAGNVTVNGFFTSQGIDDNANATAIIINGNEEVGIGGTPFHKLDVYGTFRVSGNATFAGTGTFGSTLTVNTANSNILTLNRTTSAGGYMRFQNDGTDKFYIGSRGTISGSGGTGYDIYAVGGNDIRFFPGTSLALTLDTSANATFAGDVTISKAATPLFKLLDTTYNVSLLLGADDANTFIRSSSSANLYLQPGGSTALTLLSGGSVGIGTTSPETKLDVAGSIQLSNQGRFKGWYTGGSGLGVEVGMSAGDGYLLTYNRSSSSYGNTIIEGPGIQFVTHSSGKFYFQGGNVGVGTTSPTAPLTIAGSGADGNAMLRLEATAGSQTFNWISSAVYPNLGVGKTAIKLFGQAQGSNNQAYIGFKYAGSGSVNNTLTFGFYANNFLVNLLANGNFGIGTTSPVNPLHIKAAQGGMFRIEDSSGNIGAYTEFSGGYAYQYYYQLGGGVKIALQTNGNSYFNGGNVGIGTTIPSCGTIGGTPLLHAYNNTNGARPTIHVSCHDLDEAALLLSENSGGGGNWGARLYYEGSGDNFFNIQTVDSGSVRNPAFSINRYGRTALGFNTANPAPQSLVQIGASFNQNLIFTNRINASPFSLRSNGSSIFQTNTGANAAGIMLMGNNGQGWNAIEFYHKNTSVSQAYVGRISTNSSSTSYVTSSDYRLKENVIPMSDSISRINQLKPSRFNFIIDPEITVDGFLAHEVQDIVPEAIVGDKDEIDEEGNPVYQGIDQAKLVPLLVAAIQELEARVKELENK